MSIGINDGRETEQDILLISLITPPPIIQAELSAPVIIISDDRESSVEPTPSVLNEFFPPSVSRPRDAAV